LTLFNFCQLRHNIGVNGRMCNCICVCEMYVKLYFYYNSSVHKTYEKPCILESEISAMLIVDEYALIGNQKGQLHMIERDTALTMRQMNGHTDRICFIVYCSELSRGITGSRDKTARVWNLTTGECVHVLKGHTDWVYCAAVHGTAYVNCTLLIVC
jgi:WD40 repeat protein